ncbi:PREDICTED: SH3 domain-binding glutamic acid-rich protein-like [Myotis brandtii]|uniref:SH3 domain-binding glutamic acid-rich protein-like n=1 Tax=Myotis brandtii TaxID=109478 RepID=UPI000704639A|nr:PREDICTED: SH3 domain-binding glutamic acid-rich protein-like [Myotis brandtii]
MMLKCKLLYPQRNSHTLSIRLMQATKPPEEEPSLPNGEVVGEAQSPAEGTEKAGESGENEAPKEDKEDEGDLTEAQAEKAGEVTEEGAEGDAEGEEVAAPFRGDTCS